MDRPSELYIPTSSGGYPDLIPVATITTGGIFLLVAAVQAVTTVQDGTTLAIAVLDFVFFAAPGVTLVYTGFWMPRSNVGPKHYPRLIAWMLGGVAVMFGFILLRDIHPGVSVGWPTGTLSHRADPGLHRRAVDRNPRDTGHDPDHTTPRAHRRARFARAGVGT